MSVPAAKRKMSKMEFMDRYYKIYDSIMYFLLKDFGIKNIVRDQNAYMLKTHKSEMDITDMNEFIRLCNKYGIKYETEYPLWILDMYRVEIFKVLHDLLYEITTANSIYPSTEYEYNIRRAHMSNAIGACEYLLQCLQRIIHILPVNEEKYVNIVKEICTEIDLLRGWKKSTNRLRKDILKRDSEARRKALSEIEKYEKAQLIITNTTTESNISLIEDIDYNSQKSNNLPLENKTTRKPLIFDVEK